MKKTYFLRGWLSRRLFSAALICMTLLPALTTMAIDGINDAPKSPSVYKRDPFWPIGYQPKNLTPEVIEMPETLEGPQVSNSWNEAMKKVVINGVSNRANNEFIAVINGRLKGVGDTVTVNHQGMIYTWAIENIHATGSVKLRRVSAR
ncbi:MAG: hypothetical protein HKP10_01830 [Kiritimatiellales bacterium]|nr:hypothetical protein [Kiritimatiellales bacterium]